MLKMDRYIDVFLEVSGLEESKDVVVIATMFSILTAGASSNEEIRTWLCTNNKGLNNSKPVDLLRNKEFELIRSKMINAFVGNHGG